MSELRLPLRIDGANLVDASGRCIAVFFTGRSEIHSELVSVCNNYEAMREALKEILEREKYHHDHEYWHDNCGLCRMEKDQYYKRYGKIDALLKEMEASNG